MYIYSSRKQNSDRQLKSSSQGVSKRNSIILINNIGIPRIDLSFNKCVKPVSKIKIIQSSRDLFTPERESGGKISQRGSSCLYLQPESHFRSQFPPPTLPLPELLSSEFIPIQQQSSTLIRNSAQSRGENTSQFKKIRMKGQIQGIPPAKLIKSFDKEKRYNKSLGNSRSVAPEITIKEKETNLQIRIKGDLIKEYDSINVNHKLLTQNLKVVSKEVIQGIQLNHILLKKNMKEHIQSNNENETKDEVVYLIMDSLKRVEDSMIYHPSQSQRASKDKLQQIQNSLQSFGTLTNQILIQLSKKNMFWSYICDTLWKVVVQMVDSALSLMELEKEEFLNSHKEDGLQEELEIQQKKIQELQNQIKRLDKVHHEINQKNQLINERLQDEIHQIKADFREYKRGQQEVSSLEQAKDAMIQVGSKLKDLKFTIKGLEQGVNERESQMTLSLTQLVHFHKIFKTEDSSIKCQIVDQFGLSQYSEPQIADLGQTLLCHPFYPYLSGKDDQNQDQKEILDHFKIKNAQEFLLTWFDSACESLKIINSSPTQNSQQSDRDQFNPLTSPAQLFVQYLQSNLQKYIMKNPQYKEVQSESFVVQYQIQLVLRYLQENTKSSDNGAVKQLCLLFCLIFGISKKIGVSMQTFSQILTLSYQIKQCQETSDGISTIKENKLMWGVKTVFNLLENVSNIQNNVKIATKQIIFFNGLSWIENSSTMASLLIKISDYLEQQEIYQFNSLCNQVQEQFYSSDNQSQDICVCIVQSVTKYFHFVDLDLSFCNNLIQNNHDKYVRYNRAKQAQWTEFNEEGRELFVKCSFDLIWAVYKKSPQILNNTHRLRFQVNKEQQKQSPQRHNDNLVNSSIGVPEKKPNLLRLLTNKVTQQNKLLK